MPPLYLLFFLSGATSLVWETLWSRQLHWIFGTSQFAITTVLCAFMGGLAGGSLLAGRLGNRMGPPLRTYAILEAAIGLFGLAFPTLLRLIEPMYMSLATGLDPVSFGLVQFLLVGAILILPTACMGATLPVLTPLVKGREAGKAIGRLYAINTIGAVVGVAAGGFYLLPEWWISGTSYLIAVANLLLGAGAWYLSSTNRLMLPEVEEGEPATAEEPADGLGALAIAAATAGFASLALEVAWFRVLGLVLGASAYAFSLMLLAFLVGIAVGGEAGGWLADRLGRRARAGAGLLQVGVASLAWGAMWLYGWLPLVFVWLFFQIKPFPELIWPAKCIVAMLVMTPPALLMGATFPVLIRAASPSARAEDVGVIYGANTAGGVLGAFLAGFVLLPSIEVVGTVQVAVVVNLLGAVVLWARRSQAWALPLPILLAFLYIFQPPPWDPMLMTAGVYKYVDNLDEPTWAEMKKEMLDRYRLLHYKEGLSTVVTVGKNRVTGNIWLANNGKIDASTTADMPTQVLVAHLPFLFLGDEARKTMLIGLASGITLGAMNLHPEVEEIQVVEIEPSMPMATEFFRAWNHDALNDPRIQLYGNDGRNQVLLTPPGSMDLIVSEPSNPWLTGVSNLFTREFFELGRSRLRPGGVWSQWVQMYGMDERDLRSVIRTFCEVFPHVRIFATIQDADLVMVGSDRPLALNGDVARTFLRKNVGVEAELASVGLRSPNDILAISLMDREAGLRLAQRSVEKPMRAEAPINSDDNMLVEYSAPRNLHRHTSEENLKMLAFFAEVPEEAWKDIDDWISLAQTYHDRDDMIRALLALKEAETRDPLREDVLIWRAAYRQELAERLGLLPKAEQPEE